MDKSHNKSDLSTGKTDPNIRMKSSKQTVPKVSTATCTTSPSSKPDSDLCCKTKKSCHKSQAVTSLKTKSPHVDVGVSNGKHSRYRTQSKAKYPPKEISTVRNRRSCEDVLALSCANKDNISRKHNLRDYQSKSAISTNQSRCSSASRNDRWSSNDNQSLVMRNSNCGNSTNQIVLGGHGTINHNYTTRENTVTTSLSQQRSPQSNSKRTSLYQTMSDQSYKNRVHGYNPQQNMTSVRASDLDTSITTQDSKKRSSTETSSPHNSRSLKRTNYGFDLHNKTKLLGIIS